MINAEIQEAKLIASTMRKDGIVLLQSQTGWGIACNAMKINAIKKLQDLKKENLQNNFTLLADDFDMIRYFTEEVSEAVADLAQLSIKPTTIIYPKAINLPAEVLNQDGSIAFRITQNPLLKKVIKMINSPIMFTPATLSDKNQQAKYEDIEEVIIKTADHISPKQNINRHNNTIIKISETNEIKIIHA